MQSRHFFNVLIRDFDPLGSISNVHTLHPLSSLSLSRSIDRFALCPKLLRSLRGKNSERLIDASCHFLHRGHYYYYFFIINGPRVLEALHPIRGIFCLRGMTGIIVMVPDGRSDAGAIKGSNLQGRPSGSKEVEKGGRWPVRGSCAQTGIHHRRPDPRAERVC